MTEIGKLCSVAFLVINVQFALVTSIAAMFFAYSAYLSHLGIGTAGIAFILSADALAALIIQPIIAPLVHPATSRRWLFYASLILAASLILTGRVNSQLWLIAARLMQGAGFIAVLTSLITMLVQYIPAGRSGAAFGWVSLIRLIPYALVPPLFDLLKVAPGNFPRMTDMAALAALIPILALLLPRAKQESAANLSGPPGFSGLLASLRTPAVIPLLLATLLFFSAYSAVFFYLKQFGSAVGLARVSLFFTIATLVMIAVRLAAGWLFDRFDKAWLSVAALALVVMAYGAMPFSAGETVFFLLSALCGLGWGVAMPLQAALMYDVSTVSARAMNQNLLLVMMQGGFFLGPLVGGLLIASFAYHGLFIGLAALTLASAVVMLVAGRQARRKR